MPRTSLAEKRVRGSVADTRRVPQSHDVFIEYVASRYGKRNPSFSEALDLRWPLYEVGDRIHVEGWHRDSVAAQLVLDRMPKRTCLVCSAQLTTAHANRKYCGEACRSRAGHLKSKGKGTYNAMSTEERQRMKGLYEDGLTITQVGWEMHRSPSAVARALGEMGVAMRRAGPRRRAA